MLELSDLFPDDDFESQCPGPFDQDKPKPRRQRGRKQAVVRQQLQLPAPAMQGVVALDLDALFGPEPQASGAPPEPVRQIMLQQGRRPANMADGLALFKRMGGRLRRALLKKFPPFKVSQPTIDYKYEYGGHLYVSCVEGRPTVGTGAIVFEGMNEKIKAAWPRWRRTKMGRKWDLGSYCDIFDDAAGRAHPAEAFIRESFPEDRQDITVVATASMENIPPVWGVPSGYVEVGIRLVEEYGGPEVIRAGLVGRWTVRLSRVDTGRALPVAFDAVVLTTAALGAGDGKLDGLRLYADPDEPLAPVRFEGRSNWAVAMPFREGL